MAEKQSKVHHQYHLFPNFYLFVAIHGVAVAGFFLYPPTMSIFALLLIVHFLIGCIGICVTFHRFLSHRSFQFKYKWLERIFVTLGTIALQRGPIWWTCIHRFHHRYSDTPQDPHDSNKGFWFSHFMWLFTIDKKTIKSENYHESVHDIAMDPYYRLLDQYFYIPAIIFGGLLYIIGGYAWLFWGGFIGIVSVWHCTWFINSVTHRWGYQRFDGGPGDTSRNNWFVALSTYGEGWHNNHHAFPSSAKQGFFKWWEIDISFIVIYILMQAGLSHHLVLPTYSQINRKYLSSSY
ncbi:MAG: fatty acid desaturase [Chlamydiota bacterium]|nr:fatty acid desaturase [Chlamydiota bacterium]